MKKIITIISLSLSIFLGADAATVNWGADGNFDCVLLDSAGALLRDGSLARLGTFSLTDSQIQALALPTSANIAALDAAFTPFGTQTARVGDGGFNTYGGFAKVSSAPITPALQSAQIYFWLLKSTSDTTASSSLSTAFEQAIIYRNKSIDTEWSFPSDITPAPSIDTSDFRAVGGALSSGSVVLAGSYVSSSAVGTASNGQASSAIKLLSVPEPATASLGLFGLAALCGFRRRRA